MSYGTMVPDDFRDNQYEEAFLDCDDCRIEVKEKEEYILCFECQVAFCFSCSHKYLRPELIRYKCHKDHRMIKIDKIIKGISKADQNGCHKCKKAIKLEDDHIACFKCAYEICADCKEDYVEKLPAPPSYKMIHKCDKGHSMEFKDEIPKSYPGRVGECDKCGKDIKNKHQYIICNECELDICRKCSHEYVVKDESILSSSFSSSEESSDSSESD